MKEKITELHGQWIYLPKRKSEILFPKTNTEKFMASRLPLWEMLKKEIKSTRNGINETKNNDALKNSVEEDLFCVCIWFMTCYDLICKP